MSIPPPSTAAARLTARVAALAAGAVAAATPLIAAADETPHYADPASRVLGLPGDSVTIGFATVGGLLALFALVAVGYLYRRERHLDWEFQKPDAPHGDTHH